MKHLKNALQMAALTCFFVTAQAGDAAARSQGELPYPADDVWSTAVRFVRVDLDFPIQEKDRDAGYILFDYLDGAKKHKGALELVPVRDGDGRAVTRVVVNIPDLARSAEGVMLDKLGRKVREEHGSPAPKPPKAPREKKPARGEEDEGNDEGEDKGKDKGNALPRPETGELPRAPHTDKLPR